MRVISYDEFKNTSDFEKFKISNPDIGYLKVLVFTAYQAIPIANTEIIISKDFGDNRVIFYRGMTDKNGMISNIELPAPLAQYVANQNILPPYTTYKLTAINDSYDSINEYTIGAFGDVRIIQYVKMTPKVLGEANGN